MMTKQPNGYQTIKINEGTRQKIKLLALLNGETMLELIDRLVTQEEERIGDRTASDNLRTV